MAMNRRQAKLQSESGTFCLWPEDGVVYVRACLPPHSRLLGSRQADHSQPVTLYETGSEWAVVGDEYEYPYIWVDS